MIVLRTRPSAALLFTLTLLCAAAPSWGQDAPADGLEVMKRNDQATRSATEHTVMEMKLINNRDQERVRTIEGWSREVGDDEENRFARFLEPGDVKDTSLLTYDYDQKDDDIWLYLPALKKVKRILSSNKTDYFMGSDFVDGVATYKVSGKPKNDAELEESGYTRTLVWIGKEDFLVRKAEYYDTKDRLAKTLEASDIRPVGEGGAHPRAHQVRMNNLITKHSTVLTFSTLELDVSVDDKVFSQRNLRQ
jgi:hypothetical protein